ncbi:hypothetical protein FVE85_8093 [Porphyridium purpureum]|uniref:EF-hand domain-containing protein n=1 Tax=Porphyridium purpureum TaxID=35688 RepID=A0A5J4YMC8_PORPP|nr:hypothetical protein FVE85_8093 [Porphyridium purpureum]|eukprot:POR0099..scf295_9
MSRTGGLSSGRANTAASSEVHASAVGREGRGREHDKTNFPASLLRRRKTEKLQKSPPQTQAQSGNVVRRRQEGEQPHLHDQPSQRTNPEAAEVPPDELALRPVLSDISIPPHSRPQSRETCTSKSSVDVAEVSASVSNGSLHSQLSYAAAGKKSSSERAGAEREKNHNTASAGTNKVHGVPVTSRLSPVMSGAIYGSLRSPKPSSTQNAGSPSFSARRPTFGPFRQGSKANSNGSGNSSNLADQLQQQLPQNKDRYLSEAQEVHYVRLFRTYAVRHKDGEYYLREKGLARLLNHIHYPVRDPQEVFKRLDKSKDGLISYDEFREYVVTRLQQQNERHSKDDVEVIFDYVLGKGNGEDVITLDKFREILLGFNADGDAFSEDEVQRVFDGIDKDRSGTITRKELEKFFTAMLHIEE